MDHVDGTCSRYVGSGMGVCVDCGHDEEDHPRASRLACDVYQASASDICGDCQVPKVEHTQWAWDLGGAVPRRPVRLTRCELERILRIGDRDEVPEARHARSVLVDEVLREKILICIEDRWVRLTRAGLVRYNVEVAKRAKRVVGDNTRAA